MNRYLPGHPLVPLKDLGQESPLPVPGYPELGDPARRRDEVPGVVAVIQPPQLRHFYPASRVMSCVLCPSASSITSFGVR
jgi:hypothetical protein